VSPADLIKKIRAYENPELRLEILDTFYEIVGFGVA